MLRGWGSAVVVGLVVTALAACTPVTLRSLPSPSSETVSDAEISSRVSLALYDGGLMDWDGVRITTHDGEVLLEGAMASDAEAQRAVEIARDTRGVRAVESRLVVPRAGVDGS